MHRVIVAHDWQEVERVDFHTTSEIAIMRCVDCGAERQVLHMKASDKTRQNHDSLRESPTAQDRLAEQLTQLAELGRSLNRELLDGTKYATSEALIDDIAKRYNGDIDGEDIPFGWLGPWTASNHRKAKRKVLLAYKQGLVCNRCDLIFPFDELTEDHIEGDRSRGQLTDLQLLCKKCGREKGDGPPGELDVSPFKFEGETCVHHVTCVERFPRKRTSNNALIGHTNQS